MTSLRHWLRRAPRPSRIRADAQEIQVPASGHWVAQIEETITSLAPARVHALASDGSILRALELERDEDAPSAPTTTTTTTTSNDAVQLVQLGRLLLEASEAGARRHAAAYELAFAKQTELLAIIANRLTALETSWSRAMRDTAQAQADAILASAQQSGDDSANAITAMLGAAMGNVAPLRGTGT